MLIAPDSDLDPTWILKDRMLNKKKMPPRRQRILEFVQEFYSENGIPPTVRDIQKACEISSTSVVDYNLEKLSQAGYLNRRPDVARGIEILDQEGQPVSNAPRVRSWGPLQPAVPYPHGPPKAPPLAKSLTPWRYLQSCNAGTVNCSG